MKRGVVGALALLGVACGGEGGSTTPQQFPQKVLKSDSMGLDRACRKLTANGKMGCNFPDPDMPDGPSPTGHIFGLAKAAPDNACLVTLTPDGKTDPITIRFWQYEEGGIMVWGKTTSVPVSEMYCWNAVPLPAPPPQH